MAGVGKRAGAAALMVCLSSSSGFAADAVALQKAAALETLNAMHVIESMQAGADATLNRSLNAEIQAHPEQAQLFEAMKVKVVEIENRRMPEMIGIMADVYAGEFTLPELKAITAFYNSEAGKKLVGTHTEINQKAAPAVNLWVRSVVKEVSDELAQKLAAPG